MKKIVFLLLALTLLAGCNKETESTSDLGTRGGCDFAAYTKRVKRQLNDRCHAEAFGYLRHHK